MTLTQIIQKIRSVFYTKKEIDSMGGGTSLSSTLNSKANSSDLNNYLPLAGGQMSGPITNNKTTSELRIFGGTSVNTGANLDLCGEDVAGLEGGFHLRARTRGGYCDLRGTPGGSLTWGGNDVNVITEYKSDHTGYIVFSNGFIIAWTYVYSSGLTVVANKPKKFKTIKCIPMDDGSVNRLIYHVYDSYLTTDTTDTIYKDQEVEEGFDVTWLGRVV